MHVHTHVDLIKYLGSVLVSKVVPLSKLLLLRHYINNDNFMIIVQHSREPLTNMTSLL